MAIGFIVAAIGHHLACGARPKQICPMADGAGVGCGMTAPGIFAFAQTLAGPQATGKWYGRAKTLL